MTNSETFEFDQTQAPRIEEASRGLVGFLCSCCSFTRNRCGNAHRNLSAVVSTDGWPLWVLALAYRIPWDCGRLCHGRVGARRPVRHAVILGFIGLAASIIEPHALERGPEV